MGHVNFDALKSMSDKKLVEGMPKIDNPTHLSEGCLIGKQTRSLYPTQSIFREIRRVELEYGDLCRPITPPTPSEDK